MAQLAEYPLPSDIGGLSEAEYQLAARLLGRAPNHVELGMIAAMWSEHCGYTNSRPLLKRLPTAGRAVLQGPGENAGAVDIGDGLAVVLKMESHNHPSAVEPFEGAATGVGGILRDIFTMGARPIALLDSLRFGPPEGRSAYLTRGVVAGISAYGNCVGVPTVGGEVFFHPSFTGNPLVNVMCVGLVEHHRITRARAGETGDLVVLVGALTGRDGIHGATFASAEMDDGWEDRRPAVQVGNPFLEKLLLEACLEILEQEIVSGMQDLGAAGLTSSLAEMASRGGRGLVIEAANVPRRELHMTPYEVMLSESQERMILVVGPAAIEAVQAHFQRWELSVSVIGRVTDDGLFRILDEGVEAASVPVKLLTDEAPTYTHPLVPSPEPSIARLPVDLIDANAALLNLIGSSNLCSRAPIFRQYDHMVQTNTVIGPGLGAAVLRVKGTTKGLAITTDGNPRYCQANPRRGAQIAVAEAARNLACRGARPIAVTDCLNFGNPERPEPYWALSEAIDGIAEACRALDVPVVSGNVSLYNETNGDPIAPSPIIGMVGLIDDLQSSAPSGFQADGDAVILLGPLGSGLECSEYLAQVGNETGPAPAIDLALEARSQSVCRALVERKVARSAQDCSDGGLAIALAECTLDGNRGFMGTLAALDALQAASGGRIDAALFGEAQSRFVISCRPDDVAEVKQVCADEGLTCTILGTTGGLTLEWGAVLHLPVDAVRIHWAEGLNHVIGR
ncbi:MAG: phosphoribosylformylglycinamidine synthase subunit PurL [Chloroflexota bacterium]